MEGEYCVEGFRGERQVLHVHSDIDPGVVEVDRHALDVVTDEQPLEWAVGRNLKQAERRPEQLRLIPDLEREQPVSLVRAAPWAVKARVCDEPAQVRAAARAHDLVPGERQRNDLSDCARRVRVVAARYERLDEGA